MSLNRRRDPLRVDTVVLAVDTDQYRFVDRDGAVVSAGDDAFGITMESGEAGDPVPVTRLGFCPVVVVTAAGVTAEKTALAVGADGKAVAANTGNSIVGVSEEAAPADDGQTGAWIDCVSANRVSA